MSVLGRLFGGMIGVLWQLITGLFGGLWGLAVGLLEGLLGSLWSVGVGLVASLLSLLSDVVIALGILVAAVGLRLLGVDDVYGALHRPAERTESASTVTVESIPDLPPAAVTDDAGHFSQSAFTRVTGVTPAEFIHLFVIHNGGRVRQSTLNTCLPWAKSTVSRYLDALEAEGVVTRVSAGGQNIVCTPEAAPVRATE